MRELVVQHENLTNFTQEKPAAPHKPVEESTFFFSKQWLPGTYWLVCAYLAEAKASAR